MVDQIYDWLLWAEVAYFSIALILLGLFARWAWSPK
jgi:hypothetical protein